MFRKILIANRGEIAVRVLRACRELGIAAVVAYSDADRYSLGVLMADDAICIGPGAPRDSYLDIVSIVGAAQLTGADAIHPGYGFLSENPDLADACAELGITLIGPSAQAMTSFGDKVRARNLMAAAGVPVLPGTRAPLRSAAEAAAISRDVGFPLIIKAVAGGGGRGMRVVHHPDDLSRAFTLAEVEAQQAFGNGSLYLERLVERGRHVEIQVAVDKWGDAIHLGERDCSLQRRHQKVIEEAPARVLDPAQREELGCMAARALAANGYHTVGTAEFIMDRDGQLFFLEVNARLQVEHPVTELVTGIDLVQLQIGLAAGERLPYCQTDVGLTGHAIECRVTAEDPSCDFRPGAGRVSVARMPAGPWVRVDTHLYPGCDVPPYYDSLLAKIITWGRDRNEAIGRMQRALAETQVEGVPTNLAYLRMLVADQRFAAAEVDVEFIDRHLAELVQHGLMTHHE